jgi:hypothetical protein
LDEPKALKLVYILEKGHAPMEFGTVEYAVAEGHLAGSPSEVIRAQAEAFIRSYLARKRDQIVRALDAPVVGATGDQTDF